MDPISDFLIQLKNANRAGKEYVVVPFSNVKMEIAEILKKEGYLSEVAKKGKKIKKYLYCELVYNEKEPMIKEIKRISKPSKRVYAKAIELHPVLQGYGLSVISTPKGLMTEKMARKEKVGGEILFELW